MAEKKFKFTEFWKWLHPDDEVEEEQEVALVEKLQKEREAKENLPPEDVCVCGDSMKSHSHEGHTPVSMRDYYAPEPPEKLKMDRDKIVREPLPPYRLEYTTVPYMTPMKGHDVWDEFLNFHGKLGRKLVFTQDSGVGLRICTFMRKVAQDGKA